MDEEAQRRLREIAVDDTPSRPEGASLTSEELPLLLPAGWDFDHLFGGRVATAADWQKLADAQSEEERQRLELPNTSTGYVLTLAAGLLLLLTGMIGAMWWRRERAADGFAPQSLLRLAA